MNNSIIDLLIRIKNGYLAKNENVVSPHSTFKEAVVKKLEALGYIKSHTITKDGVKKQIQMVLVYDEGVPAFTDLKIFSKPGRRWYVTKKDMKQVLGGLGYGVVSTPKGLLTSMEAKQQQIGGELLFEIW